MLSYELCLKLKEAGFPQDTEFDLLWMGTQDGRKKYEKHPKGSVYHEDCIVVATLPTLEELIESCGKDFNSLSLLQDGNWLAMYIDNIKLENPDISCYGKTPEEAVANLWIQLYQQ